MIKKEYTNTLINYLSGFISNCRIEKFIERIDLRTRFVTIALEDIYQPHNASAVLRSCECFGIQDVHIIENKNKYTVNPDVALGSSKWLTLTRYNQTENNTVECIQKLKTEGYRIIATSSHKNDCNIEQLQLNNKIALFFGTEMHGLSKDALNYADGFAKIPMFGFTESFNISVSAAVCLYSITTRLRKSNVGWQLSDIEKSEVMLQWLKNSIKDAEAIEADFKKKSGL